jgi:antitoxin (DNA-binding transcriptional repressor) of toxin-antitoxin stability system
MKKMTAGRFRVNCLAIIDQVQAKRETVLITRYGKPIAKLVPADGSADDIFDFMAGKGSIVGDIASPSMSDSEWANLSDSSGSQ